MEYKFFVKTGLIIIGAILSIVTLGTLTVFAANPVDAIFTDALLLSMILMQLLTVSVLMHIHDALTTKAKGGRRR